MHINAYRTPSHFLVLPAAGSGQRMGSDRPKQYLELLGKPLLQHTLERLGTLTDFERIVLVVAADCPWWSQVEAGLSLDLKAKLLVVNGGQERWASVQNGLQALQGIAAEDDWVLVHDVVRPCVSIDDVQRLMQTLQDDPVGGLLATPVRETLKRANDSGLVLQTVDRSGLWAAATPQMFRYRLLVDALQKTAATNRIVTDEAEAVEASGYAVRLVQGGADNPKITYPQDLALAALILAAGR